MITPRHDEQGRLVGWVYEGVAHIGRLAGMVSATGRVNGVPGPVAA